MYGMRLYGAVDGAAYEFIHSMWMLYSTLYNARLFACTFCVNETSDDDDYDTDHIAPTFQPIQLKSVVLILYNFH